MEERALYDYWMVLYSRKWIILAILIAAVITSLYLSENLPRVYEAKVVFFVPAQPSRPSFFTPDAPKTMVPTLLTPIPRQDAQASYIAMLRSSELARMVNARFPQKALADFRRNVDIEVSKEFMLQVYARDRDPKVAAAISNAYLEEFDRAMEQLSEATTSTNQQTIAAELAEKRQQLAAARKALQRFEAGRGVADLSQQTAELVRQKASLESSLENVRIRLRELSSKILGTQQQLGHEASLYIPSDLLTNTPSVDRLKKDLADLEAQIGARSTEVSERHPDLIALRAQFRAKREELAREVEAVMSSRTKSPGSLYENLRQTLTALLVDKGAEEAKLMGYQRTIASIEAKMAALPEVKAMHDELVRQVRIHEVQTDQMLTNLEESRVQIGRPMQVAALVDPATPPEEPAFPILWLNVLVSVGLGFIGSIFYCFLLDYIQRTRAASRLRASVVGRLVGDEA